MANTTTVPSGVTLQRLYRAAQALYRAGHWKIYTLDAPDHNIQAKLWKELRDALMEPPTIKGRPIADWQHRTAVESRKLPVTEGEAAPLLPPDKKELVAEDISSQSWREYHWLVNGQIRTHRIYAPEKLFTLDGSCAEVVVDVVGTYHCVPAFGEMGCIVKWAERPASKT